MTQLPQALDPEQHELDPQQSLFPVTPAGRSPYRVADFIPEVMEALQKHLAKQDDPKWLDTWLERSRAGQELRTMDNIMAKYNAFLTGGQPVDELAMMGDLAICEIRKMHPELSKAWDPQFPDYTGYVNKTLWPAEALYAFAAWLTSRTKPIILGAQFDASVAAEVVNIFCRANNLPFPRDTVWPVTQPGADEGPESTAFAELQKKYDELQKKYDELAKNAGAA